MIPLRVTLYQPGAAGVPSISQRTILVPLQTELTSYQHTISATFGFESMQATIIVTKDDALWWMQQLMAPIVVSSPDAETVWEGYLTQVQANFGQEVRSISLDSMTNRLRTRYTTVLGTPGTTGTTSNASSIARYGTKDGVLSLPETTSSAASALATARLAAFAWPQMTPQSSIGTDATPGDMTLTLTGAGWYTTLGWVLTSRSDTSSESTTTQVGTLIGASYIGATNPFLSTSTAQIASSGLSDTRYIAQDTSYRDKIEALLKQGTSAGERLAWGVYADRTLYVSTWAGATPSTVTYRRSLNDGRVYDAAGGWVPWWNVRPDAMVETVDLLDVAPVATAADAAARFYVERVTCNVDRTKASVTLEPQNYSGIDARLAALG